MSLAHSPQIVTNGLAFYYDMGNPQKSWQGRPTINLVSNPNAAINVITDDIPQGIGGKNVTGYASYSTDYAVLTLGTTSTAATGKTFTYSLWMRSPGAQSTYLMYVFDGTGPDSGWWNFGSGTLTQQWQRYTGTVSVMTGTVQYIRIYRLNQVGTIQIAAPQFEESTFATPFVLGTRFANNNLESTPSFPSWNATAGSSASGGTLTFSGGSYNSKSSWDLYKTYSGLTAGVNYTWSALVRTGTASNLIVTMNNTSAWNTGPSAVFAGLSSTEWTRISITGTTNTGSFNLHLGASFNTEVAATSQSAGTIFIQDVRLQLTGSQTTISDLMDQNTITASSLTYNSDDTFSFNGSQYLSIPDNASIRPSSGYITTEVWFKATATGSQNGSILINKENEYEISAGGGYITYAFRPNWAWVGATAFNTNQNYCVTITYDQVNQKMYLNGVEVYSAALTGAIGNAYSDTLKIGARGGTGSTYDYFTGNIYNVKIYNRGLSASEVAQNFAAQRGRYGI